MEFVSSHFSYAEEYVLSRTPEWVNRKYEQALKEKWEESQARTWEGFKSLSILLDMVMNKGKNIDSIMPPSYETARDQVRQQELPKKKFKEGTWWKG